MKEKNLESTNRGLALAVVFAVLAFTSCHRANSEEGVPNIIVFEGTLEKLGPDVGFVSGRVAVYRLAKYRVKRVCEGRYDAQEIVVDHQIFSGKEFEGVNINDRVCVKVKIADRVLVRYDAEGIRSPSDDIKIFYVAHEGVKLTDERQTCCANPKNEQ